MIYFDVFSQNLKCLFTSETGAPERNYLAASGFWGRACLVGVVNFRMNGKAVKSIGRVVRLSGCRSPVPMIDREAITNIQAFDYCDQHRKMRLVQKNTTMRKIRPSILTRAIVVDDLGGGIIYHIRELFKSSLLTGPDY